jgi:hypothetical protein
MSRRSRVTIALRRAGLDDDDVTHEGEIIGRIYRMSSTGQALWMLDPDSSVDRWHPATHRVWPARVQVLRLTPSSAEGERGTGVLHDVRGRRAGPSGKGRGATPGGVQSSRIEAASQGRPVAARYHVGARQDGCAEAHGNVECSSSPPRAREP